MALRAVVKEGRLRLDEPTDLPDGTVLELIVDDEGGAMVQDELDRLNAALSRASDQIDDGKWVDGNELLARLDAKDW